jgi:hypothetical protein
VVNVDEEIRRIVLVSFDPDEALTAEALVPGADVKPPDTRWDSPGGAWPHWSQ